RSANRHTGQPDRLFAQPWARRTPNTARTSTARLTSPRPASMRVATGTPGEAEFPSVTSMTPSLIAQLCSTVGVKLFSSTTASYPLLGPTSIWALWLLDVPECPTLVGFTSGPLMLHPSP